MKIKLGYISLLCFFLASCNSVEKKPEPHLELGQEITFVGAVPGKDYVVVGYRSELEGKTQHNWNNQPYIVFTYINKNDDVKVGAIHRNAILKK